MLCSPPMRRPRPGSAAARGLRRSRQHRHVFLSHRHLDHVGGLEAWLMWTSDQRLRHGEPPPTVRHYALEGSAQAIRASQAAAAASGEHVFGDRLMWITPKPGAAQLAPERCRAHPGSGRPPAARRRRGRLRRGTRRCPHRLQRRLTALRHAQRGRPERRPAHPRSRRARRARPAGPPGGSLDGGRRRPCRRACRRGRPRPLPRADPPSGSRRPTCWPRPAVTLPASRSFSARTERRSASESRHWPSVRREEPHREAGDRDGLSIGPSPSETGESPVGVKAATHEIFRMPLGDLSLPGFEDDRPQGLAVPPMLWKQSGPLIRIRVDDDD
jgi:hypothetical protein